MFHSAAYSARRMSNKYTQLDVVPSWCQIWKLVKKISESSARHVVRGKVMFSVVRVNLSTGSLFHDALPPPPKKDARKDGSPSPYLTPLPNQ